MNPEFIQLILGLKQLKQQKEAHALEQAKFEQSKKAFDEMVRQFEHTHEDTDITEFLNLLPKAVGAQQDAMAKLVNSRFRQKNPEVADALIQFGLGSPGVRGYGSMSQGQQGAFNQESAYQNAGLGSAGQAGLSQLQSALAQQAMQQGGRGQQMEVPVSGAAGGSVPVQLPGGSQAFNQLAQNFGQRVAQGYTGQQGAIQQQQADAETLRAQAQSRYQDQQIELGWANLREEDKSLMINSGLKELIGKTQGSLTPGDKAQTMQGIGKLIDDINNPRSDKAGIIARQRLIGQLSLLLGLPAGYFVPQPGVSSTAPTSSSLLNSFIQSMPGFAPRIQQP